MKRSLMLKGLLFFYSVGVCAPDGGLPRNSKFFFRAGRPYRPGNLPGMGRGILESLEFDSRGVIANSGGVLLNPEAIRILAVMKVEKARVRQVIEDFLKARKLKMKGVIFITIALLFSLDGMYAIPFGVGDEYGDEYEYEKKNELKALQAQQKKRRQKRLQSRKPFFPPLESDCSVKPLLCPTQKAWGKLGRLVKVLERCFGTGHYLYLVVDTFETEYMMKYLKSNSISVLDSAFLQKCEHYNKMMEEVLLQKFQEERDNRDYQKNRQTYLKLVDEKIINRINSSKKK